MDPERWKAINKLFLAALDVSESDRQRYVINASGGDTDLAQEVDLLLKADNEAGSYMETPLMDSGQFQAAMGHWDLLLQPGDVLCNRFTIVRPVDEGGMGCVFEASDMELGVHVALKIIRPEIASHPEVLARFRQEVRLARRITHANVCRTFDLERDTTHLAAQRGTPHDILFLTMEFLEGESLAARIKREGPVALDDAMEIARQMAEALEAARKLGVVHRDVKPANVMLVPDPGAPRGMRVVVTDFGLARVEGVDGLRSFSGLSRRADLIGTLAYMAPEQLQGAEVSGATDVYAFGLVLFEMVTGKRAYPSDLLLRGITQRLAGASLDPTAIVPNLPKRWQRAIDGCLRVDPAERFQRASAVVAVLEDDVAAPSNLSTRRTLLARVSSFAAHRRLRLLVIIVCTCLSLFLLGPRLIKSSADSAVSPGALAYLVPVKNETDDKTLDTLTQLVQAGLSQSAQINLVSEDQVGDTLRQMDRPASAPVDAATGREIAMRSGAVRVVFITIRDTGGSRQLDVDIQQPDNTPLRYRNHWRKSFSWQTSKPYRQPSDTIPSDLLDATRQATDWIRHEVGESQNDIATLDVPPGDVTTSNWQALEEYANSERLIARLQREQAVGELRNAVQLDPEFASAYGRLGDVLDSLGKEAEGYDMFRQALKVGLQDRLSRRERDRIRGMFALDTGDEVAAEAAFRDYANYYERDYDGWFYRAYPLMMLDRTPEAIETLKRAYEINPARISAPAHLARYFMVLDNLPEAWQWEKVLGMHGFKDESQYVSGQLEMDQGHFADAEESFRAVARSSNPFYRSIAQSLLTRYFAERGDDRQALKVTDAGIILDQQNEFTGLEALKHVDRAYLQCKLHAFDQIAPEIRMAKKLLPAPDLFIAASEALGRCAVEEHPPQQAITGPLRELLTGFTVQQDDVNSIVTSYRVRGEILLEEGKPHAALGEFLKARQYEAPGNSQEYLGRAYLAAAKNESASSAADGYQKKGVEIYHDIATHPAWIWNSMQTLCPGLYSSSVQTYLDSAGSSAASSPDERQTLLKLYSSLRSNGSQPTPKQVAVPRHSLPT